MSRFELKARCGNEGADPEFTDSLEFRATCRDGRRGCELPGVSSSVDMSRSWASVVAPPCGPSRGRPSCACRSASHPVCGHVVGSRGVRRVLVAPVPVSPGHAAPGQSRESRTAGRATVVQGSCTERYGNQQR